MNIYTVDFDESKEQHYDVVESSSPSELEKKISQVISERFDEELGAEFKMRGYQRANFDVEIEKNTIKVNRTFLVKENGEVDIYHIGYKRRMKGHSISTRLRKKVSGLAMSIHIPTPLIVFQKETEAFFKDGFLANFLISTVLGGIFALLGISLEQFLYSYVLLIAMGFVDWILGTFPATIVGEKTKDHKFTSKMQLLIFNMILMTGIFITHSYLNNQIPDPNGIQKMMVNFHYVGVQLLIVPYYGRVLKYFFKANKIKTPSVVSNYFANIFKK